MRQATVPVTHIPGTAVTCYIVVFRHTRVIDLQQPGVTANNVPGGVPAASGSGCPVSHLPVSGSDKVSGSPVDNH